MYAFGFQLFNQYCIKQLFYQTGRSTCTRSLPAGLYLSLFHNRSAWCSDPRYFRAPRWTGSPFLDLLFCPQLTDSLYKLLCSNIQHRRIPDSCSPWNRSLQRFFPSSSCMRSSRRWDISGPFSFLQECLPLSMPKVR